MKRKFLAVVTLLILVVGAFSLIACDNDAKQDGEVIGYDDGNYKTGNKTIWVVVGKAYLAFEYIQPPIGESEYDKTQYGHVFKVYADPGSDGFSPWLIGEWSLEKTKDGYGKLTITATWDESNENATTLKGATNGEAKEYTPNVNGDYEIEIGFASGANVKFKFNPNKDAVAK
ncbi:MAG: hypothetical protein ACI4M5_00265 [Christensenellales bacterium]